MSVNVSSGSGNSISYTTTVVYGTGAPGWLNMASNSTAPGNLPIGFVTNLVAGTYTADIVLTPQNGEPPATIHVSYTVIAPSLTFTPPQATFSIGASSTTSDADIKRTFLVESTGGSLSWTATSSVPWLTVSPPSGYTGSNITLSLVPAQLKLLENGNLPATVTFNYSNTLLPNQTTSLPLTLNLNLPKVDYVAPYVAVANTSEQVIVRGSGFSSITNQNLLFGTTPASSFTVISDTEIHAPHPALAAGKYPVSIVDGFGFNRSLASLAVVNPQTFAATTLTYYPNATDPLLRTPFEIVYDAERQALMVAATGYISQIGRAHV